jgi:glycogen debranching enzyme
MDNINKAYEIAKNVLRSNYKENGIYAGQRHFDDYWARDGFFASLGALELKDFEIAKKNLELFIKYQNKDGQIPLRIGTYNLIPKLLGIKGERELSARFKDDKNVSFPLDNNALFIITAYEYSKKSKDIYFIEQHIRHLELAIGWLLRKNRNYLISEGAYSSWDDSIKYRGINLYTNVCFSKAAVCMSEIYSMLKKQKESKVFAEVAEKIREQINLNLWNNNYFSSFNFGKRENYFNTAGNLLSILWNIADKDKALKIETYIEKNGINKYVPSLTNYPKYPKDLIYPSFYLINMQDYHNAGMCWLWIGCLDAIAKQKTGMKKEAKDLLNRIANKIVEYNDVFEVYEKSGKPVNRFFYKSEHHFSWSAGMFILAVKSVIG